MKQTIFITLLSLIATSVAQQDDPNLSACGTISYIVSACERLTPGFTAFTNFNFQAPCLCYASSSWFPNGYDGWLGSCNAGYRTGNPIGYSQLTAQLGGPPNNTPCQMAGNILRRPTYTGPVTALVPSLTRPPLTNLGESACGVLNGAAAYCNSVSPGFQTLTNFRDQASCYCYSGMVFAPSSYDSLWPTCSRHLLTASPGFLSQASSFGVPVGTDRPCQAVGDVRDVRNTPVFTPTSTAGVTITVTRSSSELVFSPTSTSGGVGRYVKSYNLAKPLWVFCIMFGLVWH